MQEILKQEKADITKHKQNLSDLTVGIGWKSDKEILFDFSAILADYNSTFTDKERFIFYQNPVLRGKRDDIIKFIPIEDIKNTHDFSDLQQITLSLFDIPNSVSEIIFCAAIYNNKENKFSLSDIKNLHFHIFNADTKEEIIFSRLDNYFTVESCLVFGKLYRQDEYWKYENISEGYIGDLGSIFSMYYRGKEFKVLAEGDNNG